MYKTQTKNFLLGENISISVLRETESETAHYALLKVGLFGMNVYTLCALGEDYAFETVGASLEEAEGLFDTVVAQGVSPTHIFDVVSDFRKGREMESF